MRVSGGWPIPGTNPGFRFVFPTLRGFRRVGTTSARRSSPQLGLPLLINQHRPCFTVRVVPETAPPPLSRFQHHVIPSGYHPHAPSNQRPPRGICIFRPRNARGADRRYHQHFCGRDTAPSIRRKVILLLHWLEVTIAQKVGPPAQDRSCTLLNGSDVIRKQQHKVAGLRSG